MKKQKVKKKKERQEKIEEKYAVCNVISSRRILSYSSYVTSLSFSIPFAGTRSVIYDSSRPVAQENFCICIGALALFLYIGRYLFSLSFSFSLLMSLRHRVERLT